MSKVPLLQTSGTDQYGTTVDLERRESEPASLQQWRATAARTTQNIIQASPRRQVPAKPSTISLRSTASSHRAAVLSKEASRVTGCQQAAGLEALFMPSAALSGEIGLDTITPTSSLHSSDHGLDDLASPADDDDNNINDTDVLGEGEELTSVKSASDGPFDNSPYPQVRASVSPVDDTSLSINTPRMWTLSIAFAILGSATNLFFSLRYPSVSITPVIALLLVHPLGLLWDRLLKRSTDPVETFVLGQLDITPEFSEPGSRQSAEWSPSHTSPPPSTLTRTSRLRLWLAQGRWNEKEHACVYISSNVSFGFAFATDVSSLISLSYTVSY